MNQITIEHPEREALIFGGSAFCLSADEARELAEQLADAPAWTTIRVFSDGCAADGRCIGDDLHRGSTARHATALPLYYLDGAQPFADLHAAARAVGIPWGDLCAAVAVPTYNRELFYDWLLEYLRGLA